MADVARVEDVDAIKQFRAALAKFAESATAALDDADAEVGRTAMWLEQEQSRHWANQVRKRQELVVRCKEAVRQKQIYKDSAGRQVPADDEKKALAKANALLAEAEAKGLAVQKHGRRIQREGAMYRGSTQRLRTALGDEVPNALAKLGNLIGTLERYAAATPGEARSTAGPTADGVADGAMTRPEPGEAPDDPAPAVAEPSEPEKE